MKAVNLIPAEARSSGGGLGLKLAPATYALFGVLALAGVLTTLYVLASNSVASRQAQISSLQAEVSEAQNEASQLSSYTSFASAAQTRISDVRSIASTRFDWNGALSELARVIPANTSLQSLSATVVPGAGAGGGSGAGAGSSLRADLTGPAFDIVGCTDTQDDVARLISRLEAIPGVTRVALDNAQKGAGTASATGQGCKANSSNFELVVAFHPVAGAGAQGAAGSSSTTSGGAS